MQVIPGLGGGPESDLTNGVDTDASSPTAVAPYDHHNASIALQKGKCWLWFPCVYSFVHTYVEPNLPYIRITNH